VTTREYEPPSNEDVRQVLRELPGWYVLLRAPGGYRRVPVDLSGDEINVEQDQDSGAITISGMVELRLRREWLTLGRPVQVGIYHPEIQPDQLDR
jgi:hypothetical protein